MKWDCEGSQLKLLKEKLPKTLENFVSVESIYSIHIIDEQQRQSLHIVKLSCSGTLSRHSKHNYVL